MTAHAMDEIFERDEKMPWCDLMPLGESPKNCIGCMNLIGTDYCSSWQVPQSEAACTKVGDLTKHQSDAIEQRNKVSEMKMECPLWQKRALCDCRDINHDKNSDYDARLKRALDNKYGFETCVKADSNSNWRDALDHWDWFGHNPRWAGLSRSEKNCMSDRNCRTRSMLHEGKPTKFICHTRQIRSGCENINTYFGDGALQSRQGHCPKAMYVTAPKGSQVSTWKDSFLEVPWQLAFGAEVAVTALGVAASFATPVWAVGEAVELFDLANSTAAVAKNSSALNLGDQIIKAAVNVANLRKLKWYQYVSNASTAKSAIWAGDVAMGRPDVKQMTNQLVGKARSVLVGASLLRSAGNASERVSHAIAEAFHDFYPEGDLQERIRQEELRMGAKPGAFEEGFADIAKLISPAVIEEEAPSEAADVIGRTMKQIKDNYSGYHFPHSWAQGCERFEEEIVKEATGMPQYFEGSALCGIKVAGEGIHATKKVNPVTQVSIGKVVNGKQGDYKYNEHSIRQSCEQMGATQLYHPIDSNRFCAKAASNLDACDVVLSIPEGGSSKNIGVLTSQEYVNKGQEFSIDGVQPQGRHIKNLSPSEVGRAVPKVRCMYNVDMEKLTRQNIAFMSTSADFAGNESQLKFASKLHA